MDKHDGGDPGALRVNDPWQDAADAGLWVPDQTAPEPAPGRTRPEGTPQAGQDGQPVDRSAVYLEVQGSAAFQEVRDRYRSFTFPVVAGFLAWYLLYVVAATTAPGLMGHQVAGDVNVAMVAGLAQFATTFLLTWAYARHARLRRDRAALDLRWTLATRTGQERVR
ncbi:DUF485 domain-containing protein [Streptomyces sp. CBMA29]|uniref:DUF485 domain-containing protein n=1 Tax=Streptomyces sp. CBMA29 TaxID=1896314 RepID=UPI0016618F59|nr:DUF485 domain-containing protein [Streptomyces sp. CBMA29]